MDDSEIIGVNRLVEELTEQFADCVIKFNNGEWTPEWGQLSQKNSLYFPHNKKSNKGIGTRGFIKSVALEANIFLEHVHERKSRHKTKYDELSKNRNLKIMQLNTDFTDAMRKTAEILFDDTKKLLPDSITIISKSSDGEKKFIGEKKSSNDSDDSPETNTISNTTDTTEEQTKVYYERIPRKDQERFRANLLKKYNNTCMITECTIVETLDAAHIIPFVNSQDDTLENGLLLRADLHRLFDAYLMAIDPATGEVHFKDKSEHYNKYDQKTVDISKASQINLTAHWQKYNE